MFGFGKNKSGKDGGPPQNDQLGKLLDNMMNDPEKHQEAFYVAFLSSNIFMIGQTGDNPSEGEKTLNAGDKVQVMQWVDPSGKPFIPVFTSQKELAESVGETAEQKNFIAMSGYDALNMTQGQVPVAIDPANAHCLYLVPEAIGQILNYYDQIKGPPKA